MLHQQNVPEHVTEPAAFYTARSMHMARTGVPEKWTFCSVLLCPHLFSPVHAGVRLFLAIALVNKFPVQIPLPALAGTSCWKPVPWTAKFGLHFGHAESLSIEIVLEFCWQGHICIVVAVLWLFLPPPLTLLSENASYASQNSTHFGEKMAMFKLLFNKCVLKWIPEHSVNSFFCVVSV